MLELLSIAGVRNRPKDRPIKGLRITSHSTGTENWRRKRDELAASGVEKILESAGGGDESCGFDVDASGKDRSVRSSLEADPERE